MARLALKVTCRASNTTGCCARPTDIPQFQVCQFCTAVAVAFLVCFMACHSLRAQQEDAAKVALLYTAPTPRVHTLGLPAGDVV